jgi:transposase
MSIKRAGDITMEGKLFGDWEDFEGVRVIESGGLKKLLLRGKLYMQWKAEDEVFPRVAIAQLYNSGKASQEELAEAFGLHINTVQKYAAMFEMEGTDGLINRQRGPKQAWKITPEVRFKILETAFNNKDVTYESLGKILEKRWDESVSLNSIRQVLIDSGFAAEPEKVEPQEYREGLFDCLENEQPELEFPEVIETKKEHVKFDAVENVSVVSRENTKKRSSYSSSQRNYLDQLAEGTYSAYAGGFLFMPFLQRYNYLETIKRVMKIERHEGYSMEELCLTLFFHTLFGFKSLENFKTAYAEEFGVLLGRASSPSVYTLRRFLHELKKLEKSEELIDEFSKEYLKHGIARWGVLYLDAHFMPYYGMLPVNMGWHGVRKIPMKGSYNFLAVDEGFTPLLFLVRASSEDLLEKVPEIIINAKRITCEIGLSKEEAEKLTVVFDREGYSAKLFRELEGKMESRAASRFISWAKYADKWVYDIPDEKFDRIATVKYEVRDEEELKYFETEKIMNKYGRIRTIVIESGKEKRRAAIYTNDRESEAERLIQLICRRWGQENLIKDLMMKHFIDYSPGYEAEEIKEQPMVENPEVKNLKKKKAVLKGEISKLEAQFGSEVHKQLAKGASLADIKEKDVLLRGELETLYSKLTLLGHKIDELPGEIRFDEAYGGKKLVKFNYDRKRVLDCVKVFAYNMEKQMCRILLKSYKKEIYPALSMIVKRGGDIKLEDGRLRVRLQRFSNPEIDCTARRLCEELNEMGPVTMDKFQLPIVYEVV